MATKRQRGSRFHYTVKRAKLLPKPIYLTFDDEVEGDRYVQQLEGLLDRGVVPQEFIKQQHSLQSIKLVALSYMRSVAVPDSDQQVLGVVIDRVGSTSMSSVDYEWAERWVSDMKLLERRAPSTIRHRVGALARCFDWLVRKHPDVMTVNPLRQLPRRYATYSDEDRRATEGGRDDQERDRRLHSGEEAAILRVLAGERPADRQRPFELEWQGALECLFLLAVDTAMRLREMFTLELSQLKLQDRTIVLEKTKNGDRRQVPLATSALETLERYIDQVERGQRGMAGFRFDGGRLFPWWDGERGSLNATTSRLSKQFARVFDAAGCGDVTFHDLRHEATCRLYERTTLTDIQIAKITGHKDLKMLKRYASLRGSDLAERLW